MKGSLATIFLKGRVIQGVIGFHQLSTDSAGDRPLEDVLHDFEFKRSPWAGDYNGLWRDNLVPAGHERDAPIVETKKCAVH